MPDNNKIIINFTPTGMLPQKKDTPYVPISPEEIIEDVRKACNLGITSVHLHIRNQDTQKPCFEKGKYAEIIAAIRDFAPDLVVCVSTSGRHFTDFEQRADVLKLEGIYKPDMASLTLSSINFNNRASLNEPAMIMSLAQEMLRRGIKPELEAFDSGMINYAKYLIKKNILVAPFYFSLILGNIACAQADLLHIGVMINDLPGQSIFSLGGVGDSQLTVNSLAVAMGYGVRVGLEDNYWFDAGRTKLATNIELIERIRELARANGKAIMTSSEFRKLLGLKRGFGDYGM